MPFRARSDDSRWQTTFGRFVSTFGADELAARLSVKSATVYHWVSGRAIPRPERALRIESLAARVGMTVSIVEIYSQREKKKADDE